MNHSFKQLVAYFSNYFTLNAKEKIELETMFVEHKIKRRKYILQQGEVCRHFTFVVSGCFKMYSVDTSGREHILEFVAENNWICDLTGFYAKTPSEVYIQSIEPATILQISWVNLIHLYGTYMKFNSSFRITAEKKYIELQRRVLQNISLSGEEKYLLFLTQYPHLCNRLPNTQIASYLGITSEFLSKIRKGLLQKQ